MRGYRIHEWGGPLRWEEIDPTPPGPGEVAVDVEACGIGLTVLNCINGDLSNDPSLLPRVPGHELVGRVTAVGEGADPTLMGRRVVAYFYLSCGRCPQCLAGHDSRCSELAGWVGVHTDGGYAPHTRLPAHNAIGVPDGLGAVDATVAPDAVATPVHVTDRAAIGPDDRVVVIGAGGGVGIHMIQVAALTGAAVAGLDIREDKLAEVERLGATAVPSPDLSRLDPRSILPGGRPTVVVDLVGRGGTVEWGLDAVDAGGRFVALTTFRDNPFRSESRDLVFKEASILGSRYATRAQVAEAARLIAAGDIQPVIGAVVGPDEVEAVHDELREGSLIGRGALDWSRA